jgi:hypothetical protein
MNQSSFTDAASKDPRVMRRTRVQEGFLVTKELKGESLVEYFGNVAPELVSTGYSKIFSAMSKYSRKPMLGMTEAKGKKKLINNEKFRWELSGSDVQVARITAVVCTDPKPGINRTSFDIVVDRPYFNVSDIIQPETNESHYRFLVTTPDNQPSNRQHRQAGAPNRWRYTLKVMSDNPNYHADRRFLTTGHEWRKVASAVATEENIDGGGFGFASVFESQGQVGQASVIFGLNDAALRIIKQSSSMAECPAHLRNFVRALYVDMKGDGTGMDKNGQITLQPLDKFMTIAEAMAFERLHSDVENNLVFGLESSSNYAPEGFTIRTGAGLRPQIEAGHVLEHNGLLSLTEMEEWFDSICLTKLKAGDSKLVLQGGTEFRKMFDAMLKLDSKSFTTIDSLFIRKGEDFRHLDYGSYFATYTGFNFDISVMQNDMFDDASICPQMHPTVTNRCVDSWRGEILDFGMSSSAMSKSETDNIMFVAQTFCDYDIISTGKWKGFDNKTFLPITDGGNGHLGGISGYTRLMEKSHGLLVADATRCGVMKLAPIAYN